MKDTLKNLLILVLIISVCILLFKSYSKTSQQPNTTAISKPMAIQKQITTQRISAGGTVHTGVKVVEAAGDLWLDAYYQNLLEAARDSLKIAQDQIREVVAASLSTAGSISAKIIRDTIRLTDSSYRPVQIFSHRDKYINLAGRIENDSLDIAYKTFDSLTFVTYTKRKNIFAKRELYMDAWPSNPNASLKGLQSIKLNAPKPKQWAIGITAGYYFNGQILAPGVGVGITKTIIRW
jgi:hypothetical protein